LRRLEQCHLGFGVAISLFGLARFHIHLKSSIKIFQKFGKLVEVFSKEYNNFGLVNPVGIKK
jgi:hypothetical protein